MGKFRGKHYYLGAWNYVLLDILYFIPVIGWLCLLAHAFSDKNENRKHYARSYFVRFLMILIISAAAAGVCYLVLGQDKFVSEVTRIYEQVRSVIAPV